MKKSTKMWLKQKLAWLLIVLISIESFAATVSDNDGAAFITKAEFESMKNTFQTQINGYMIGIDNKISNVISSYLSGIVIGKVSFLESYLNKVNALAEDYYLDSAGNKVKYNYRTMARRYQVPATNKPNGARTALFISRGDINGASETGYMRLGLTNATRTGMALIDLANGMYQTGKYFMYNIDNDGNMSPANAISEYTYYYYVSGAARTTTAGNNPGLEDCINPGGIYTEENLFKNERTEWSLNYNNVKWVWNNQIGGDAYSTIKCVYGTTFQKNDDFSLVPICGVLDVDVIGLSDKNKNKMTLQENTVPINYYGTITGFYHESTPGGLATAFWLAGDVGADTTLYMNCHPYNTVNLKDMCDVYSTGVLDEKVKLTDGIPVCKATDNGYIDIKMEFLGEAGHKIGFGIKKERLTNAPSSYYIDSSLRDFNNVLWSSRTPNNIVDANTVQELRIDVKKGDVIFIKCVDTTSGSSSDYTLCGARTQEIKQTSIG